MRGRTTALALAAATALALGGCGDDKEKTDLPAAVPATTPAQTSTATTATGGGEATKTTSAAAGKVAISTDLSSKPEIPKLSGKESTKLVAEDIVKGSGRAAKAGDNVVVHYVGVLYDTGEQFDASWDSGRPFNFALGQGNVIPGWDKGLEGMKVGGRRILVIPSDLAYGDQGQGPIPPGATLVFVVDMLNATPA